MRKTGITLWVAVFTPQAFQIVKHSPVFTAFCCERMFHNIEQAVETYLKQTTSHK
jgi:hypothetical protein